MSTLPHFFLMAWRRLAGLPEEYSYPPCEKPLSKEFVQLMKNRLFVQLMKNRFSEEFVQLMKNRLVSGALRYGPYRNNEHGREQVHAEIITRLTDEFIETGNQECLVDIATIAAVEFVEKNHPHAHWRAKDRTGGP